MLGVGGVLLAPASGLRGDIISCPLVGLDIMRKGNDERRLLLEGKFIGERSV